jgi:hypothetical protein
MSSPTQPSQAKSPVLLIGAIVGALLGCFICTGAGLGLGYVFFGREPGKVAGADKAGVDKKDTEAKSKDAEKQEKKPLSIIGRWRSIPTEARDKEVVAEFKEDGSASLPGNIYPWNIGQLPASAYEPRFTLRWSLSQESPPVLTLTGNETKKESHYRVLIDGDTLTLTPFQTDALTRSFRRLQ